MSADEYRAASHAQWEGAAEAWERNAERLDAGGGAGRAAEWVLEAAGLEAGADVLELACGPAGVGLAAAERVGRGGHVLCTDFAAPMVEAAARRAQERGLDNVDARVLDAERMELPDGTFDAVICRFGYMLMADPPAALAETRRVLAPGGRVALAVWAEADANPWIGSFMRPIMEHFDAPPPAPGAPGIFSLADADRLTGMLRDAGFDDVHSERLEAVERHASADAWWAFTYEMTAPLRGLLDSMGDEDREAVRARAYEAAAAFADGDTLALPSAVRVASARRAG
ncbi:MAG: methyltransferase domain-containing protein [Thermoleophilaceae bacterium]